MRKVLTTHQDRRSVVRGKAVVAVGALVAACCFTAAGWALTNPAIVFPGARVDQQDRDVGPSRMDHWRHQDDFMCYACHPGLFSRSGRTSGITHAAMLAGRYCGACHNGVVAFRVDREDPDLDCDLCHED